MHEKRNTIRMTRGDRVFTVVNMTLLILMCLIMVYPFWNTFMTAISDPLSLSQKGNVTFLPEGLSTEGFRILFREKFLPRYFLNTILYASLGTIFQLTVSTLTGFALSFKRFCLKKLVMALMLVTMYISGGLIPTYLLIRQLGWFDTVWVMTVPGAINVYNVIIFKTFFQQQPYELREAAYLDGATDLQLLTRVILPLSKALLATFAIFSIVGYWNSWFDALIYLRKNELYPIQNFMRSLVVNLQSLSTEMGGSNNVRIGTSTPKVVRAAAIVLTTLPIMLIYPFFQKYFAKGIIVGSLKG